MYIYIYIVFHKNKPSDFLLYFCQIVYNFYKHYPVCTLENVLSSTFKTFLHIQYIFFVDNYKQNREHSIIFN